MSVTTTSDEKRYACREKLEEAIKVVKAAGELLSEATDPDTWGYQEYSSNYQGILAESEIELIELRLKLTKIMNRI